MSDGKQIVRGPTLEEVLKSLTTHGSSKQVLHFTLEGGAELKAVAYSVRDTGTVDTGLRSQVYAVGLSTWTGLVPGHAEAEATYYIDVETWGNWTFPKDDYP